MFLILLLILLLLLFFLLTTSSTVPPVSRDYTPTSFFSPIGYGEDLQTVSTKFLGQLTLPTGGNVTLGNPYPQTNLQGSTLYACPYWGTPNGSGFLGPGQGPSSCDLDNPYGAQWNMNQYAGNPLFTDMSTLCQVQLNGQLYTFPLGVANWIAWANWYGVNWYGTPLSSGETFNQYTSTVQPMGGPEWFWSWVQLNPTGTYSWAAPNNFTAPPSVSNPGTGASIARILTPLIEGIFE